MTHPGDCRAVLAALPDASVQCCVTSPPYANLRDYGHPDQIGAEATAEEYIAELVNVFRLVRRVLRDDGTLWLNLGDGMADKQLRMIPARVALALQADAWVLRSDIIWAKPNPMPESCRDRPTSAHEHVFLLSKRSTYFWDADAVREAYSPLSLERSKYQTNAMTGSETVTGERGAKISQGGARADYPINPNGANCRNVWTIATQPYSGAHFATMPPELAERCIKAGTSERGQCPHCSAPWARVTRKGELDRGWQRRSGGDANGEYHGSSTKGHAAAGGERGAKISQGGARAGMAPTLTVGWSPTCACPEHIPVPQTVLDCFAGAGTTGLVADRLGRNAVLIELNPAYAGMARDRITDDAPLFAHVALAEAAD